MLNLTRDRTTKLVFRTTHFMLLVRLFLPLAHTKSYADELPQAPEGTFSIVVIPDTQHYAHPTPSQGEGNQGEGVSRTVTNPTFAAWTNWIAANLEQQRIVFVSHVGDIVDKYHREQWAVARRCMDQLHGLVPYGISVGNHDMVGGSGDSTLFQEVFPLSRFENFGWYGGCYVDPSGNLAISGNNANSVQLFEGAGKRYVALHLECNAPDNVLAWADRVLDKHSDRRAMITTHMGLGPLERPTKPQEYYDAPKGRMNWKKCHGPHGNTPQQMWDKCFCKHRNLFMVCCGDQSRTQAMRQTNVGSHGNPVHEVLSDYGTNGLRVMRFVPDRNMIEVRTWDPIQGKLCTATKIVKARDQHQFSLQYSMTPKASDN
jgi:hypothetical protein